MNNTDTDTDTDTDNYYYYNYNYNDYNYNDYNYRHLKNTFLKGKLLINYITAGYPTLSATVAILLKLQRKGTDIVEVGVPFTDPIADGPIIQEANRVSLENGTTLEIIFKMISEARNQGLTIPIVLMGYYNSFYQYGLERLMKKSREIGINGFIVVDLSPKLATKYVKLCEQYQRGLIPLISLLSSETRIKSLCCYANCFIYCIAVTGVTGCKDGLDGRLPELIKKVRRFTNLPLAVGFGISTASQAEKIWDIADAVIMGSMIVKQIQNIDIVESDRDEKRLIKSDKLDIFLEKFMISKSKFSGKTPLFLEGGSDISDISINDNQETKCETQLDKNTNKLLNIKLEHNQFLPEILIEAHQELELAFDKIVADPESGLEFRREYNQLLSNYVGRPTPLYLAKNLSDHLGGANIWLKREDLNHTGSHKINNAIGQALLAKKMGKTKIIAETGAGQHGIATATACCLLGLKCTIYMGEKDVARQATNVDKIRLLGAELIAVDSGSKTLRDAINGALRDWLVDIENCYYLIGSAIGAHPYPEIVAYFQSVIGKETKEQFCKLTGMVGNKLPDYIVAAIGGGSNAIGIFNEFINDKSVELIGVEAGGDGKGATSASISQGKLGVLHGTKTYLLQDQDGQIRDTHSISAGLDYPGVGPHHSYLHQNKLATYVSVTDGEAVEAFRLLIKYEGIIPALESSHAIAHGVKLAKTLSKEIDIIINLSGRGEKDIQTVNKFLANENK